MLLLPLCGDQEDEEKSEENDAVKKGEERRIYLTFHPPIALLLLEPSVAVPAIRGLLLPLCGDQGERTRRMTISRRGRYQKKEELSFICCPPMII